MERSPKILEEIKLSSLLKAIDSEVEEAEKLISKFQNTMIYGLEGMDREEKNYLENILASYLENIHIKVLFALELLGLTSLLAEFKSGFNKYKQKLSEIEIAVLVDAAYSLPLEYMKTFISAIGSICGEGRRSGQSEYLKRILLATPNIIKHQNLEPKNEADVRNAIWRQLSFIFPDTLRNVSIPKVFKTFKPDLGIATLKTAIEYKFVDSEEELKTAVGGIYEDMHGYSGSLEWEFFWAVIYQTEPFYTEDQLITEFKLSDISDKWGLILVGGYGSRQKRKVTKKNVKAKDR